MSPKYQHAINLILAYVRENRIERDDRLPSEREFERLLGVARPAMNIAVACLISQGLLRREGYKLRYVGEAPKESGLPPIHIIHPHSSTLYRFGMGIPEAAHDIAETFGSHTIPMLIRNGEEERAALTRLLRTGTNGVVLWPLSNDSDRDLLAQFQPLGIPFVVCDQDVGNFDFVGVDNETGARLAVEHLKELGHKNIVYITQALTLPSLIQRYNGYRQACIAGKMRQSENQIIQIPLYSYTEEQCAAAFTTMRNKYPAATAFVGSNDLLTLWVLAAAKAERLRLPEELSAVGFDDIDAAAHAALPLTTIRQSFYEIGIIATQLLFQRMRKTGHLEMAQAIRIRLQPRLIERASTTRPSLVK